MSASVRVLVGAWSAMHGGRRASTTLGLALLTIVAVGGREVSRVGWLSYPLSVPATLLAAIIAGFAVGLAAVVSVPRHLPDPVTAQVARAAWVVGWTVVAVAVVHVGRLVGTSASTAAITRNVLLFGGLCLLCSRVRQGRYMWLVPTQWLAASLLFGRSADGFHPWAFVIHPEASGVQLTLAAVAFLGGLAVVASPRGPRLRGRSRPTTTPAVLETV